MAGVVQINGNTHEVEETLYTFDPNEIMRRIQIPGSDTYVCALNRSLTRLSITTGLLAADGNLPQCVN